MRSARDGWGRADPSDWFLQYVHDTKMGIVCALNVASMSRYMFNDTKYQRCGQFAREVQSSS